MGVTGRDVPDALAVRRTAVWTRRVPATREQRWLLLVLAFAAAVVLLTLPLLFPGSQQPWVLAYRTAAVTLALVLAAAALVHTHLTSDPAGHRLAAAAVLVAAIAVLDIVTTTEAVSGRTSFLRLVLSLAASACLVLAVTGSRLLRRRVLARVVIGGVAVFLTVATFGAVTLWAPTISTGHYEQHLHMAAAGGWLCVAMIGGISRVPGPNHRTCMAVCAVAMAGASIAPAITGLATDIVAAVMPTVALAVALGGFGTALVTLAVHRCQRQARTDPPRAGLAGLTDPATRHEVSNVLVCLEAATTTLGGSAPDLEPEAQRSLTSVVSRDIGRLRYLLDAVDRRVEPVDLRALVEERTAAARARGVRVDLTVPAAPVPAVVIRQELIGAIDNLLLNAEQHAVGGARPVLLDLQAAEGQAVLTVSDQGPGIDPSVRPLLFQAGMPTSPTSGGSGLGLSLARDAAVDAGGSLREMPADRGACFELRLPLAAEARSWLEGERA